jgi:hypothetical protein
VEREWHVLNRGFQIIRCRRRVIDCLDGDREMLEEREVVERRVEVVTRGDIRKSALRRRELGTYGYRLLDKDRRAQGIPVSCNRCIVFWSAKESAKLLRLSTLVV